MRRPAPAAFMMVGALALAACSSDGSSSSDASPPVVANPTVGPTVAATSTSAAPPASEPPEPTIQPTTEPPATTEAPTTTGSPTKTIAPTTTDSEFIETRKLGESVEGRPIMAERRGTRGGRVVLIIGVIHGDENDGLAIMDRLHELDVPAGVDLWLVDSMNPDGLAENMRHNAHQVDLNRNFPENWGPIGVPGDGEYAGPSAASEPETQAMVAFISDIRPDLTLWYHQDLYRIAPGRGRDGRIRQRYADLTGLPVVNITGGTYTGVAATWARNLLNPGVAFIVELGDSLTDAEADMHAEAVLTVAAEDI
jgi:protein MpaA